MIRIPLVSIIISIRFGMDSYYIINNFYGKINHTQFHTCRKLFKRFFSDLFFQCLGFQFIIDQMKQIFYRVEVRTPCWDTEALKDTYEYYQSYRIAHKNVTGWRERKWCVAPLLPEKSIISHQLCPAMIGRKPLNNQNTHGVMSCQDNSREDHQTITSFLTT